MKSATVRIPAATTNLGPGLDCLGVALRLYNQVTVRRGSAASARRQTMIATAAARFFEAARMEPFPFDCSITGEVPSSRGLGSSVTVRLGLLHGLNALAGGPLEREELFMLCAKLEGHPDNAAASEFGGFTVAGMDGCLSFDVEPSLSFVLLIPEFEVKTPEARKMLPDTLRRTQAALSTGNAARITAAFAAGRYEALRGCFEDGLHQPFREPLIPFLTDVIRAGESAGALGGFLSGSGSTIACVTLESPERVAAAMLEASRTPGRTVITTADNDGAKRI